MTTYATLKTDVADYLARSDLTARIPTFVAAAEDVIRFGLHTVGAAGPIELSPPIRVDAMAKHSTILGNGTRNLPLPDDVTATGEALEFSRVWLQSDPIAPLTQVSAQQLGQYINEKKSPRYFARITDEFEFDYAVGTGDTVELVYYEPFARLALDADTNWLLTNCYTCYLYGALLQSAPFLRHDDRIPFWTDRYVSMAASVMKTEMRAHVSQGQMLVTKARAYG